MGFVSRLTGTTAVRPTVVPPNWPIRAPHAPLTQAKRRLVGLSEGRRAGGGAWLTLTNERSRGSYYGQDGAG